MKKKATPKTHKFNREPVVKNGEGEKAIESMRRKYAKHRDKPTTAAADPSLRLPQALMQVDPQAISQVLPNMYKQLGMIRNLLIAFNSKNSSSNSNSPNGFAKLLVVDSFSGALCILSKKYGYTIVLERLFGALDRNRYQEILTDYQEIVFEAIIKLIKAADEYGEADIPVSTIPEVTWGSTVPTPLYSSYDEVPDEYIQQYYNPDNDPYPGYIQYLGPTEDYIYVKRKVTDYPYETAEEEIRTTAEYAMTAELSVYIKDNNLTVEILNRLLVQYCTQMMEDHYEKNMGKNSKNNVLSMLTAFAGIAGTMAKSSETNHIPNSVLDVASMTRSLENHRQNIGKIMKMKSLSNIAFNPMGLLNSSISSALSSALGGKVSSAVGLAKTILSKVT